MYLATSDVFGAYSIVMYPQILALEDEIKAIPGLKKTIEQYKDRIKELDQEKFKAQEDTEVSASSDPKTTFFFFSFSIQG